MELRFFRNDEWEKLVNAIELLWAPNHIYCRNVDLLKYLVYSTPYREAYTGVKNTSFVGAFEENDEVLGILGIIPQEANVFGKSSLATTATIIKVNKEKGNFVGLDLFEKLLENRQTLHLSIGINNRVKKLYKVLGYDTFNDLTRWVGFKAKDVVKKVFKEKAVDYIYSNLKELKIVEDDSSVFEFESRIDETLWDKYYNNSFSKSTIGVKRDYKFLNWRYFNYPFFEYKTIAIKNNIGEYCGIAIYRVEEINNKSHKICRICEFIYDELEHGVALAQKMISSENDILFWDFYCLSNVTSLALEYIGFNRMPASENEKFIPTRFQPIDYSNMNIKGAIYIEPKIKQTLGIQENQCWYVTKGDADQDRPN